MSSEGISALERSYRLSPRHKTLTLLADALALRGEQRQQFEAAAAPLPTSRRPRAAIAAGYPPNGAGALPLAPTSFVGREVELEEVLALVDEHRLVTIIGAGGVGKTQMALRVGASLIEDAGTQVHFGALATTSSTSILSAIAAAVGVREASHRPLLATLLSFLKSKKLCLILDNCEHVLTEAASAASALVADCPRLQVLATSREPLKVAGERLYRLPPLSVPTPEAAHWLNAARAATYGAITLFVDRARAVDDRFTLTDENAATVAALCRRLDGVPLAIELAAARMNLLSVKAITERLDECFRILTSGDRIALPRQQTMRATIDWSYELLSAQEQRLFERLATFVGGFTLEAVEAVTPDSKLDALNAFVLLSSLAEKSLVVAERYGSEPRYRLLETTRAFALEKLTEAGDLSTLARRHAQWVADLADRARTGAITGAVRKGTGAFEPELENARSAINWALSVGEASLAARVACGFTGVWRDNYGLAEPRRWLEAVLCHLDAVENPSIAAAVWHYLSSVSLGMRRVDAAKRALELYASGDPHRSAGSLLQICAGLLEAERIEEAEAANDEALQLCQKNGLTRSLPYAQTLDLRASIANRRGHLEKALDYCSEALSLVTELDYEHAAIVIGINIGELEYRANHFQRALDLADATVVAARRVRSRSIEITALANSAACRLALGDVDGARVKGREALALAPRADPEGIAAALQQLAIVAALRGDANIAARLCGYVDSWHHNEGCAPGPMGRQSREILLAALRAKLDDGTIKLLISEGSRLSEEQAVVGASAC